MKTTNENLKKMCRRTFVNLSGSATLGAAISLLKPAGVKAFFAGCPNPPILPGYIPSIASAWIPRGTHESSYATFKKTIEAATDFSWLSQGDNVFLKLSLNSGGVFPTTTDPWLLKCMIKLMYEKGAKKVLVGDQSGAEYVVLARNIKRGSSRNLCSKAGLLDIIAQNGAQPVFFEENGYYDYFCVTPPKPHHWPRPLYITKKINQFDHIIYLPRVGAHVLTDFSAGIKIAVGFLRDDSRLVMHNGGENFYAMYEEINQIHQIRSKLRLIVSSGLKVLTTIGPDFGHVSEPDYGLIFASDDLLAHDAMSYAWLRWNYEHNTPRSAKVPAQVNRSRTALNQGLMNVFFAGVHGYNIATKRLPTNDCLPKIYSHRAMKNYVDRIGGCPQNIAWNQITQNPDRSVQGYMSDIMNIPKKSYSVLDMNEKTFTDGQLTYESFFANGFQIKLNGQFHYRITDLKGSVMEYGIGKGIQRVGTHLSPGIYTLNVSGLIGNFNRKIIKK